MGEVAQELGTAEIQFTSQDEGPGSGSMSSMIGGSLPPAREGSPKKASGPVTTYETFTAAVEQLAALVKIGKNVKGKVAEGKTPSLNNMLELSTKTSKVLGALVASINNIPNGGKPREVELNECLLPMARQAWLKTPPTGNAKLLLDVEGQYVEPLDDDNQPIPKDPEDVTEAQKFYEKRLKGVQPYLALVETGRTYPDIEPYLRRSEKIRTKLDGIRARMAEKKEEVEKAQEVISKIESRGKEPDDMYVNKLAKVKGELEAIKEEIPPLFEDVNDVQAHEVAEALAAITIESSVSIGVMSKFLESSWSIERLIVAAALAEHHPSVNAEKIKAPLLTGEGRVEMTERELDRDELIALAQDKKKLSELFRTLEQARDLIEALLPTLSSIPELNEEAGRKVKKILRQPFTANDPKVNKEVLERLFAFESDQVNAALAETLTKRAMVDLDREKWTLPIEGMENIDVLRWAVTRYMFLEEGSDEFNALHALFESSPKLKEEPLGILSQCRKYIVKDDSQNLANFLNEQIEAQRGMPELYASTTLLMILHELAESEVYAERLRHQIPSLEEIKTLADSVGQEAEELTTLASSMAHACVKRFSSSLEDFKFAEDASTLMEAINIYKFLIANPEVLEGIEGNSSHESGLFLVGPPRVGKTFLIDCIIKELGVKHFTLTPSTLHSENGDDNIMRAGDGDRLQEAVISKMKEAIEYTKVHKDFCVLILDEAETYCRHRKGETTTMEQADRTAIMLQMIDTIRKKYPKILLVAATNYPDEIDDAIFGTGRFDYVVTMDKPNAKTRKDVIQTALGKHEVPFPMSEEQLDELAELSDGFVLLNLTQLVHETFNILVPMEREKKPDFEADFEFLKKQFEKLKARRAKFKEVVKKEKS